MIVGFLHPSKETVKLFRSELHVLLPELVNYNKTVIFYCIRPAIQQIKDVQYNRYNNISNAMTCMLDHDTIFIIIE